MSGKKGGFRSLSDAADLLKNFGEQLSEPKKVQRLEQAPTVKPAPEPNSLRDIEKQMLQRAKSSPQNENAGKRPVVRRAKKTQVQKLALGAAGMAAYRKHLGAEKEREPSSMAPAPFVDPQKRRREAFEKVRELVGKSSPEIEPRPHQVSASTRSAIEGAIAKGAEAFAAAPEPDLDNGFIVGFDFGTSSLKLAVRQPYKAGDPLAVMPVPSELRSGSHPYLWQTALWFDSGNQTFSLVPGPGFEVLEGFKTGIIGGNGGGRVRADVPVIRSVAATAFLTLQLAHFLGWYHENRPLGAAGGDKPLSINIGIPVAAQDDKRAYANFRRILAAAQALLPAASHLTLAMVQETYYAVSDEKLPPGWELIPELTAAIAGYAASPMSQAGSHMLVDVGASTLDIVAFNLLRGERIAVISAAVELLGSASLEFVRTQGVCEDDFKRACDWQFEDVFHQACKPERGANCFSPKRRRQDIQLVTTGGGCATSIHATFIAEMTKPGVLGPLPIVQPEPPAQSVAEDCDLSRLLLAYGLTRDVPELLELKLPSQVPTIPPKKPGPDLYISKDLT